MAPENHPKKLFLGPLRQASGQKVWKIRNQSPIFNKDSDDLYRANEIFKENLYEPGPELVNEQITKYRISSSSEETIQVFFT